MATRDIYADGFDESSGKTITATECPECDGDLRTEGGEISCTDCGLIVNEYHLDHAATPLDFPDRPDRERTGAPLTAARHDRGLSTEIGFRVDGKGNQLSSEKRKHLGRLRREHTRAKWQSKAERNLGHGCTEIARLVSALDLDRSVREQASALFRTAQNEDLLRGRSIEGFAAACVYAVCRCTEVVRTLGEVVETARCSKSAVTNAYRVLNAELDLPAPPQRPREFVAGQVSAVGVPPEIERSAVEIAEAAWEDGVSVGVHPAGFAAACVEVACHNGGVEFVQGDLAEAAGVSAVTVRTHRDTIEGRREAER
ncbi:transcription initiation factor IIB [Halosimplex pelagicum]|uniref:Transcription initiation factor IIB family protein n=1 Tax=Halosimplex pelagicum TaxID=869886 RepID=A0A7D5PDT5_9EURY|nr:transcription initiation factor IIB family protein [Halosimplex pelagicum]QLH81380.1 transcription initiation factor IIB family protein [Halosimplex pelagicum]